MNDHAHLWVLVDAILETCWFCERALDGDAEVCASCNVIRCPKCKGEDDARK